MSPVLLTLALVAPVGLAKTSEPWPEAGWMVDRWTTADGLPLDHMLDVQIDPHGFAWLATLDGLVRFDGASFRVLRRSEFPELPTNRFIELAFSADGRPWVVTAQGDLARFDADRFTVWPRPQGSLGYLHVRRVGSDVWVSGPDGLARLGEAGPEAVTGFRHDEEALVVAEVAGEPWVGTPDGIYRVTEEPSLQATRIPVLAALRDVYAIRPAPTGGVWVGAKDGLWHTDGAHAERVAEAREGRPVCAVVWTGRLWIGDDVGWRVETSTGFEPAGERYDACFGFSTAQEGERGWRAAAGALLQDEVALPIGARVRSILPAPDGSVWVATDGDGLLRLRRPVVTTVGAAWGPLTTVLADAAGRIWARERGGRTYRLEGEDLVVAPAPAFRRMSMPGMAVDPDGATWFATREGICVLDGDACDPADPARWSDHFEDGRAMLAASDGRIWLGRDDGLVVGSRERGWAPVRLAGGEPVLAVSQLVEAADGAIWAATLGQGVIRFGPGAAEQWMQADGLSSDRVRALWLDPSGAAWVGSEDAGLCRLARGQPPALRCLGRAEGLFDDAIHSLAPSGDGRLWLSSNRGIFRVELADLEAFAAGRSPGVVSLAFDERDGMQSREANGGFSPAVAVDPAGRLWWPTQAGLARIDPREVDAPAPPRTFLEGVRVEGEPAPLEGPLTLSPDQRELAIRWTTPEYARPDQVRFRYRLVGVDDAWRGPTPSREAAWTSLPAGSLSFEVQANVGGGWGPSTTLAMQREPRFSETPAFLLSVVAGVGALGGLGLVLQSRRARRREEELEALITARTSALAETNQALRNQTAMLETQAETLARQAARLAEVDARRKRLVADLSHELRTPLTLVAGPLEDLAASGAVADGPARDTLDLVIRNTARLEALVAQLLDVARLEGGRTRLRVARKDLGGFLRGVGERFLPESARRGLALTFELPDRPVWVYFDPDLLDKVVSNLLGNALKFTAAGGTIQVRLLPPAGEAAPDGPDDETPVRVEVRDTGIGVAEDVRDRLFERFVQGDRGDARRFEGVGIGLSLARDLVGLHGGEIGVVPLPIGSSFWFTLPGGVAHLGPEDLALGDDPVSPTPAPREAEVPRADHPEDAGRPLVLVVEDHAEMREFLAAHLRHRFTVATAGGGSEALALARARRPAAIVSDVMMPGMDGLELCRKLRADPALAAVPVLLASAKAGEDDRVAALEIADDYLAKPLRMRELLARVQNLVSRGPGLREAALVPAAPQEPAAALPADDAPLGIADRELQQRIEDRVAANLGDPEFGVDRMARVLAMSRRQLLREVQRVTGQSPSDLLRARRLEEGQRLLRSGAVTTVGEAAARVGLSLAYFSRTYTAWFGVNPSVELRR